MPHSSSEYFNHFYNFPFKPDLSLLQSGPRLEADNESSSILTKDIEEEIRCLSAGKSS
ncbi:hypothetical protein DPMN_054315 [Dreissena polymorpha]|uniref:Uncharacterized protein n=1 Tax=Dreissena polymorpha TaxID=45954 RepID=A0A9D4CQG4_DREPO|nr:hypothetical protein DPMN_054315 [Dreissena polymorpha]